LYPSSSGQRLSSPAAFTPEQTARCAEMIEKQLQRRGIREPRVLSAMRAVPRHMFVPEEFADHAYEDRPLPIGEGQTISQPYIVASMTEALELTGRERVLEIGTGCGYQTAVLSLLDVEVYAIERYAQLAEPAKARLAHLGYSNVHVHVCDGTLGWPEAAPFDAILVGAAAPRVPRTLVDQLAQGGRMVLPVGQEETQTLLRIRRTEEGISTERLYPCRFVPLVGCHGWTGLS